MNAAVSLLPAPVSLGAGPGHRAQLSTALAVRDPWAMVPSLGNLDAYIGAVNRLPMLTADDEASLARRLRDAGDLQAAGQMVLSHLRLVVKIARQYLGYGLPHGDLIQEGNVGLMKAVRRFDPDQGVRLVSYAMHWIKAEIHEYIMKNWRMVKVATTKAQRKLFFNLRSMKAQLKSGAQAAPWLNAETPSHATGPLAAASGSSFSAFEAEEEALLYPDPGVGQELAEPTAFEAGAEELAADANEGTSKAGAAAAMALESGSHRNALSLTEVAAVARRLNVKPEEVVEMETRLAGGDVALEPQGEDDEEGAALAPIAYLADERHEPSRLLELRQRDWLGSHGIAQALGVLDERSRRIVQQRWLAVNDEGNGGMTLHELAAEYGVSAERVRQIETTALKKMRKALEEAVAA